MKYYISDPHFDHKNIMKMCKRPFMDIKEMNEKIISNWNKKVNEDDEVYILGDIFMRTNNPHRILARLNGKKYLIIGNHDELWLKSVEEKRYFVSISESLNIVDENTKLFLSHYPESPWNEKDFDYKIYGHVHNNYTDEIWPLLMKKENMLNACVEVNNYEPVTLDELKHNNTILKENYK